ncbi:hypothetical protein PV08_01561 [Exophiala spinifera]|uniref:Cation/H+ exchanger transmembrane domain-containing protein n=1 Tax=Exophiala spinifera TaxID=91928 RepID=A0A0D2A885_9EURO|nr:uncharacterized protein PV08_01561 [Exophiala spinifera]KIW20982.1 hypothetical protein PV08_01561 [Exophiala spinifera]
MVDAAIPYPEPSIDIILVQSSFLLLSNIVSTILDHVFYCGLVGQIVLGMAWGTPGSKLLSHTFEQAATQLGYLGLISIVFEGGLATSVKSVQENLFLSICVAATGISLPIVFSFSLLALTDASNLQAFAAGAALCSTSLGTTFSLLKTTGLTTSRLGIILTSAAMLDDVVGLIMVQVITNLGSHSGDFAASTLLRPILVSLGFAILLPLFCKFVSIPACKIWSKSKLPFPRWWDKVNKQNSLSLLYSTGVLIALVSAATYAGTSALFAAYLAGVFLSWFDEQIGDVERTGSADGAKQQSISDSEKINPNHADLQPCPSSRLPPPPPEEGHAKSETARSAEHPGGYIRLNGPSMCMYDQYYSPVVERILKPLFFGSIGFSIPITEMFRGTIVWRGIVYAMLMAFGKVCCGLWLVRFTYDSASKTKTTGKNKEKKQGKTVPRPKSLYPAWLLGSAMVVRGEIGFLISALAASNGIFAADGDNVRAPSEIYLVVTWAILLCTITIPIALGLVAKRVKRLQKQRQQNGDAAGQDPLGTWGVGG